MRVPPSNFGFAMIATLLVASPAAALCPLTTSCVQTPPAPQPPRPDARELLQEQAEQRALLRQRQLQADQAAIQRQRAEQAAIEQQRLNPGQSRLSAGQVLLEQQRQQAERQELERQHQQTERRELQQQQQAERLELERSHHRDRPPGFASPPQPVPGAHLPPGFDPDRHHLEDYERHHLQPPGPKQFWVLDPPYDVLLDGATGTILDAIPETGIDGLEPRYNVGIAWSAAGSWATRTGTTPADAEAQAVAACSAQGAPCANAGLPVSADAPACYALVRSGTALFGAVESDAGTATDAATQRCTAAGGTECLLQVANCNDHP